MDDDSDALGDLLCLTMVAGVGPITCQALLERFGTASKVLDASIFKLKGVPGVGPKLADKIVTARADNDPMAELAKCRRAGVTLIPRGDPAYPPSLEEIPDPPSLLYVRGTYEPSDQLAVGLVGSRKCTPYGIRIAEKLAASLARVGITVVSGLARGIDAAAHRGALKAGGRTLAVVANGLASVYPPEHDELAAEVAAKGAIISETPLTQEPIAALFLQRNRIISGLCLGIVVVEAAPRSGALSTARHAGEQNREVFAVPGPVDSLASQGCHRLIRDGAKLVETVDDILEELGPLVGRRKSVAEEPATRPVVELSLSDEERKLLDMLGDEPKPVDALILESQWKPSLVMSTLSLLEMRRLIRRLPGPCYVRV